MWSPTKEIAPFAETDQKPNIPNEGLTLSLPRAINVKFPQQPPEILHHTVWRTWLFIVYSNERWLYHQFSILHLFISLQKVGRMYFFELGSERVKQAKDKREEGNWNGKWKPLPSMSSLPNSSGDEAFAPRWRRRKARPDTGEETTRKDQLRAGNCKMPGPRSATNSTVQRDGTAARKARSLTNREIQDRRSQHRVDGFGLEEGAVSIFVVLGTGHEWYPCRHGHGSMAVARNLCAGGQARGAPVTPVSRGVWGHVPPENFEI